MQSMPSLLDRRRLKDRIVESVSKAVKQIQEYQFNSGLTDVVLTNHDWQFCKLVEHLDHAFLHGLRHITNGYWAVVQDFTHKATTKEIKRMTNVTTNLGRGRAWLYLALVDHLLESYLHCFINNLSTVKRFYAKEALVLDQQRMEILLTLAAGLEFITFQLDVDVPYLDLSSHMRPRLPSQEDSLDRISLCSMDSSMSQSSSVAELDYYSSHGTTEDRRSLRCENGFINEDEENHDPQKSPHMTTSASMPVLSQWDGTSRMERVNNMPTSTSFHDNIESSDSTLEVIHVKTSKSHRLKKPRRMKKRSDSDLDPDRMSLTSLTSVSSEPGSLKKRSGGSPSHPPPPGEEPIGRTEGDGAASEEKPEHRLDTASEGASCQNGENVATLSAKIEHLVQDALKIKDPMETNSAVKHVAKPENSGKTDLIADEQTLKTDLLTREETDIAKDQSDDGNEEPDFGIYKNSDEGSVTEDITTRVVLGENPSDKHLDLSQDLRTKPDSADNRVLEDRPAENGLGDQTIIKEVYSEELSKENESPAEKNSSHVVTAAVEATDDEDVSTSSDTESEDKHPSEVKVDINYLLLLKLHVLQDDEEQLLKIYRTSLGHAEGEVQPVYIMISSLALYILTPTTSEDSLNIIAQLLYTEIDYILLGVGDQIITIVCTNRRRQFWITTGDEKLTRHIVSLIDRAIRQSPRELPHLSILTEPTQQRIALRKWAAKESKLEMTDTIIYTYVLVHWCEVPSMDHVSQRCPPRKEGMLLVRTNTSLLSTPSWKPYYFVLKDGMLYQYSDKHSGSPPKACVQLSGEECAGCRRSPQSDRPHSFELILSDESVLQMSAKDAQDTQDWLLSLCQAVAEGHQNQGPGGECLAGCCVVTQNKLLICHEDIQTNFFRTLGSGNVTDVTAVLTDPVVYTYLVIAFETQEASVTSEYWTLYFNAKGEKDRFLESLGLAWTKQFKVALPVSELVNIAMMKHCREGQIRLHRGSI